MYPLSEIKAVRRSLVAALEEARLQAFCRELKDDPQKAELCFWKTLEMRVGSGKKETVLLLKACWQWLRRWKSAAFWPAIWDGCTLPLRAVYRL